MEFTEWTKDGRLRHPSFKGLREDKKAQAVKKESVEKTTLTHPEKILYKEDKITKQDLFDYYQQVSSLILPHLVNRPLTLVRCPSHYEQCFFQKKINQKSPPSLHSIPVTNKDKSQTDNYIYIEDEAGLLSLVQLAVLEIHPWGSQIDRLEYPDRIIFDLDPSPELAWKEVVAAANEVKHYLAEYQLKSFVKTTGGKGLHVVIPIQPEYTWEEVKNFSQAFVQTLESLKPDKYLSQMSKTKRKGKIFIDYLRNQRGATAVAAYSTRARIHAPVSTPLEWDELTSNKNDTDFTLLTLAKRLKKLKKMPWESFWTTRQSLNL